MRIVAKNLRLGPRDRVLGQLADCGEECGADRIVEIPRLQLFLRLPQTVAHVIGERSRKWKRAERETVRRDGPLEHGRHSSVVSQRYVAFRNPPGWCRKRHQRNATYL